MNESLLAFVEITFNILYLITIWLIVFQMYSNRENLNASVKKIGILFLLSFFMLALGDTCHVGFRVLAHFNGGIDSNSKLVGIGALATAITITFFYMIFAEIWHARSKRSRNYIWWGLIIIGLIRLLILIPSDNHWESAVPPFGWSLSRNIALILQGIPVAILMFIHGKKENDKLMLSISYLILISFVFYFPVILFVRDIPLIGMLMIPKTLAYVVMAFMSYDLFKNNN